MNMNRLILEKGDEKRVYIPEIIYKRCGFLPHQEVIIEEGKGILVIHGDTKSKGCPQTIEELFALPASSLVSRALGGEGGGDFNEEDID